MLRSCLILLLLIATSLKASDPALDAFIPAADAAKIVKADRMDILFDSEHKTPAYVIWRLTGPEQRMKMFPRDEEFKHVAVPTSIFKIVIQPSKMEAVGFIYSNYQPHQPLAEGPISISSLQTRAGHAFIVPSQYNESGELKGLLLK